MPSATYQLFRAAILNEKQVVWIYNGCYRELCPHIIGYKDRQEKVLAYQFGGESHIHAAGDRREMRDRVPYDREGKGLRVHSLSEAVIFFALPLRYLSATLFLHYRFAI